MNAVLFHVRTSFTDVAVSPMAFPALDLVEVAVHTDEEHVQAFEQTG